jgi:HAD superfamily hydrolase (TIGR01459 family)
MSSARIISGLGDVAGRYDALFCDVWGVIHNGRESFADATAALARFKDSVGPVVLVSNAPRPSEAVKPQLTRLGVPDAAWSSFVTSGDATRAELARLAPGPALAIGPSWDLPLYEGTGVTLTASAEAAAFISCTGLYNDETETPDDYRDLLAAAATRRLPMVCANPDRVVHRGEQLIWCAGSLADVYRDLGGEVLMAGKPHAPIYRCAMDSAAEQLGRPVDPTRILCIGDGVGTDVAGANNQGLDCLFIGAGIHGEEVLRDGAVDADRLAAFLDRERAIAAYAIPKLVW